MTDTAPQPRLRVSTIEVTPLQQNCSLIWDTQTKEAVFVDPGGDVETLIGALDHLGLTLKEMWLTHGHLDHAGAAADLRERTGAPVIGPHKEDQFWLDQIEDNAARFGLSDLKNVTPDRYLEDGDVLELGGEKFNVVHTPGHTPGHVVIYNQPARLAFVGDVLFKGSIGRTDFPRGDFDTLVASITEKLWPLGEDMTFVSGHGPMSTFGHERRTNSFVADIFTGYAGAAKIDPDTFEQRTTKRYT